MENLTTKKKNNLALAVGFFLIILVSLVTFSRPTFRKKTPTMPEAVPTETNASSARGIESNELSKKIMTESDLTIIDIRSEGNFNKEHIVNSKNISASGLANALPSLDKERTYVIVSDMLSIQDTAYLEKIFRENGFQNYFYLIGGFSAWKSKYNPTLSEGNPASFVDQSKVSYITAEELKKLLDSNSNNVFIIDLRKSGQFGIGHIKNAVNIFLDDLENQTDKIVHGKKIILYDNDGLWAFKGAVRLYDLGIFNVFALSDGLDAWKKKGFEIVK